MTTLKPCPFCNSSDIFLFRELHPKCRKCGATQCYVAGHEAVASWNKRALAPGAEAAPQEQTATITQRKGSAKNDAKAKTAP